MNNNFFEDIIPSSAVQDMKRTGESFANFSKGIQQIINFQLMLYEGLQDLGSRINLLKSSLNNFESNLSIEDEISKYLDRNPVGITAKTGFSIDESLETVNQKISEIYIRLNSLEDNTKSMKETLSITCNKNDLKAISIEQSRTQQSFDEIFNAIELIQNHINKQKSEMDNCWDSMKSMFKTQAEQTDILLNSKQDKDEMKYYITSGQLAELLTLFSNVSSTKKTKIPEIINQVFQDTSLTIEQKIQNCYKLLEIEKDKVITDKAKLIKEFRQLKKIAESEDGFAANFPEFYSAEVRDIGSDSGVVEIQESYIAKLKKRCKHISILTFFDGPKNVLYQKERPIQELIDEQMNELETRENYLISPNIEQKLLERCESYIEKQVQTLSQMISKGIDSNDLGLILQQLKKIQECSADIEDLKIKISLKLDQSLFLQELKNYLTRDDFYNMMEEKYQYSRTKSHNFKERYAQSQMSRESSRIPSSESNHVSQYNTTTRTQADNKIANKQKHNVTNQHSHTSREIEIAQPAITPRKKKQDSNAPPNLVPARNPKMMGVNQKFIQGPDGRLYLKEMNELTNNEKDTSTIVGTSRTSYYDRSKRAMSENINFSQGVDSIIDYQPFVPFNETSKT